ncbi:uncharacterized protein A4U43_C08F9310 [Asparagus officinalis]|uniref:serine/arginine-rich SC35-like splicing factor SCL30A isoform X1 n=1 Tax=Asparagus officinalis TaxID=4686 RepID=UPI00098DF084|nr:serine/arginine-rich SC35-like splicing factor SCL30A isoform X1 [Asparagus officinalis]ONK59687.1 uncharacterized protein A4U43_C08F9310 [Asparagus officinalis]
MRERSYRERSYSYSPPPRGYGRRGRSPSPGGRYGGSRRDLSTSLLVRNLHPDCRPEDLRRPFGQFGPLKDVYLPRDYYTGEPRGFGFVQYVDPADAEEAKYEMDRQIFFGRELTVVFAKESRKKPAEMRAKERTRSRSYDYRSPPRHSRSRYSRSPSPRYSCSPSPRWRGYSRSVSPRDGRYYRGRSRSYSPSYRRSRSRSEEYARKRRHRERSLSVSQ